MSYFYAICPVGTDPAFAAKRAFILADVSLERPSCYFELGLMRATNVPIYLIAAEATPIHQVGDSGAADVAFYSSLD